MITFSLSHLSDTVLLRDLADLVVKDRVTTAELLAHLAEVESRRLHLRAGYPSMYMYCVHEMRLSEDAAYKRIQAARVSRRFPILWAAVADGRLNLTGLLLLAPHLNQANADDLLRAAEGKSKAEMEVMLARRFPRSEAMAMLTAVPSPSTRGGDPVSAQTGDPGAMSLAPGSVPEGGATLPWIEQLAPSSSDESTSPRSAPTVQVSSSQSRAEEAPQIEKSEPQLAPERVRLSESPATPVTSSDLPGKTRPIAPGRFDLQLTMSHRTHEKLLYAQALLRHLVPSGALPAVLDHVLEIAIRQLEKRKFAASSKPRARKDPKRRAPEGPIASHPCQRRTSQPATKVPPKRYIPAHVRRTVWKRDRGRCTFVGTNGRRCEARGFLEFDHVRELARGGRATVAGIRLRCRAHNQFGAECTFGAAFMEEKRRDVETRADSPPASG